MAAEPVEKRRSAHLIALTGYFVGLPVESVVRVVLHPPHSMEFKQVRGTLRTLSGHCTLRAVEEGTEVQYRLEADLGIPMITDDAARQFLVQFVERMLDRIKLAAERKAPARRPDRGSAAESSALEPGLGEPEEDEPEPVVDEGPPVALAEGEAPRAPRVEAADAAAAAADRPPHQAAPPRPAPDARGSSARPSRRRRRRRHHGRGQPREAPPRGTSPPG